jgi:hypothetical protein
MPENRSNTGSMKSKFSYAKAYAKARVGKAMTSAQKVALKKAQEASARARSLAAKAAGGETNLLRMKRTAANTASSLRARAGLSANRLKRKGSSAASNAALKAKQTVNKNLQRAGLQSTGAGKGSSGRAKVIGRAGAPSKTGPSKRPANIGPAGNKPQSTGPSKRPRGNGMGMQVKKQADIMSRRGALRATALRTAKNYVKANRKNKK